MKIYQKLANIKKDKKHPLLTDKQILLTKLIIIAIFFIMINLILLSFSDNLRISLQINGSYSNYKKSKKKEKDYNKKFEEENKPKRFKLSIIKLKNESINKLDGEINVSEQGNNNNIKNNLPDNEQKIN